jgi:MoaA/NifB/PqqE/SkfB family radical SAM enzyme
MNPKQQWTTQVDEEGRLIIPAEIARRYGLHPGAEVALEGSANEFHVLRPVSHLAKVYIEPTDACNLTCVTCMRNVWDEPLGRMEAATFARILDSLGALDRLPTVFFGGFGEPLAHPGLVDMVRAVKALGGQVELITNGILLDERRSLELVKAGLNVLWVSLDGASPESYADVRLGASFPRVIENLRRLQKLRGWAGYSHDHRPTLGIAFVAMKRNIADLPEVIRLGISLGAKRFSISNVAAHDEELLGEVLYENSQKNSFASAVTAPTTDLPVINLPRIDTHGLTLEAVGEIWRRKATLMLAGKELHRSVDTCQFIEQGAVAIRWDGAVSPCLPLLHTNDCYFGRYTRRSHAYTCGNINERSLRAIWEDPAYTALRRRIQQFDFSPCVGCTGCELSVENKEDCLGNPFPTCGGCLWAQGLVQCP